MRSFTLLALGLWLSGCTSTTPLPKMEIGKFYERDMIVQVNGITREGAITMPLLPVNKIHIWTPPGSSLDILLMKTCGGVFKKQRAWNIRVEIPSGLFGWGSRKIDVLNEAEFEIAASDFTATGICPVYLSAISQDGQNSEGYINWQVPDYKLGGQLVCNMVKRNFAGVEVCNIAQGSYTRMEFDEEVQLSPDKQCEFGAKSGKTFEWRVKPGTCNYVFESKDGQRRGVYTVYGWTDITIRK